MWCTVIDPDLDQHSAVVKQVFADFPPEVAAGPAQFRGHATMGEQNAAWDLTIRGELPPLRPLRPPALYRMPLPRTKLEATVPDGQVAGKLDVGGHSIGVSGWRGTVGHNWGSEHADTWVWLHAAGFKEEPGAWLDLVLARIRVGPARLPWTAMGALGLGGERIMLGGLGRRPTVDARPGGLTCDVPSGEARLQVSVTARDDASVIVPYTDPRGGTRAVSHAALATVGLTLHRPGHDELTLARGCGAYEYGTSQETGGSVPRPLPEG
jgi:hypothetical protein